jgi:hypothetical protein
MHLWAPLILCTDAAMDVRLWSTHNEVLLLCRGTMLICTRAEKQGGRCVLRPRSSATAFAALSRAGHTCRHEMARLRDMKSGDVERIMVVISNLHERRRLTEKGEPRHNRQLLHTYTNNITAPATSGQPWTSSAMASTAYANNAAASRRRAQTPSITAPHLHRQHRRTEKTSSDIIVDGSAYTPVTHTIQH